MHMQIKHIMHIIHITHSYMHNKLVRKGWWVNNWSSQRGQQICHSCWFQRPAPTGSSYTGSTWALIIQTPTWCSLLEDTTSWIESHQIALAYIECLVDMFALNDVWWWNDRANHIMDSNRGCRHNILQQLDKNIVMWNVAMILENAPSQVRVWVTNNQHAHVFQDLSCIDTSYFVEVL